jgi:hypothetical protein
VFTARFANHDPAQQPRAPSAKDFERQPGGEPMLIAVGNPRTGADAFGALGLAHLVGALGLAALGWQPSAWRSGSCHTGHAESRAWHTGSWHKGDGNQSLAFLGRHSCRDVVPSPHFDLAHCWLAHLVWRTWAWRTQTWRSWMRRSSQGEWQCQTATGPQEFGALVFGTLACVSRSDAASAFPWHSQSKNFPGGVDRRVA